jgi:hypothetical protein
MGTPVHKQHSYTQTGFPSTTLTMVDVGVMTVSAKPAALSSGDYAFNKQQPPIGGNDFAAMAEDL